MLKRIAVGTKPLLIFAFVSLLFMTVAVAETTNIDTVIINEYGLGAPFLKAWFSVWFFSVIGGLCSLFIRVDDIDKHFRFLYVAKPILGVFGGMSLCLLLVDGNNAPTHAMSAYAGVASFVSAPLLQAVLAAVSYKKNQQKILNKVSPIDIEIELPEGDSKK